MQYFGDRETLRGELMWRLVGEKGAIYTLTNVFLKDRYQGEVFKYGKLTGWLPFSVASGEQGLTIIYSGPGTTARYVTLP